MVRNVVVLGFALAGSLISPFSSLARADFQVEVTEAPTNNQALTVSAIQSARQNLLLNIYELSSPEIADALLNRIQAGVRVEILEEGQPVGGMSAAAKGIQAQIVQAIQQARAGHFYVMTSKGASGKRRYRFDHAKYAVIDDTVLLIGSENYSPTGNPSPGTKGNRGWEVLIHDADIAQKYKSVFTADAVTTFGDVIEPTAGLSLTAGKPPKPTPAPAPAPTPAPGHGVNASAVTMVTSPNTSLSGLVALIDQATTSLDIQQMTFDSAWSSGKNPLVAAIERAAARGVQVRVLLNDEAVFNHGTPGKEKNKPTVDMLNQLSNVSAKIANLKGMGVDYIHNKGALVDGRFSLISSINWDENSIQHNREAAVVIESPDVFTHYESLFEGDWQVSGGGKSGQFSKAFAAFPLSDTLRVPFAGCPSSLELTARIGKLTLDSDDESFASIDQTTIMKSFTRERNSEDCVLSSKSEASGISGRSFIEIKTQRDGIAIVFEGYTPKGNKLYSIRAHAAKDASLSGTFPANVFNGSSAHEFLGKAELELISNE